MADNTVCEGDVVAPKGVILGDCVLVEGDVYTDGAVELGAGAHIEGQIRPMQQIEATTDGANPTETREGSSEPEASPAEVTGATIPGPSEVRTQKIASPRSETELELTTLGSTFRLMLDLAKEHGVEPSPDRVWGLEPGALEDLVKGALVLVSEVYLERLPTPPWPRDILVEVVFGRALASVVPATVEGIDEDTARLRLGRPDVSRSTEGWPTRVVSLIRQLGEAARPGLRATLEEAASPDPDEIALELEF